MGVRKAVLQAAKNAWREKCLITQLAPDYHYPPMAGASDRPAHLAPGRSGEIERRAKYNSDIKPQGMLFATLVISPHAHARVKSIDSAPPRR